MVNKRLDLRLDIRVKVNNAQAYWHIGLSATNSASASMVGGWWNYFSWACFVVCNSVQTLRTQDTSA